MPVPDFILRLRRKIGHDPLLLPGITAVILRTPPGGHDRDAREVLLVRQASTGNWTPIGGCIEPGEDPDQTAVREVEEETGIRAALDRLLWIQALPQMTLPNGDVVNFLETAFRGRPLDDSAPYVADDESDDVGWFPVDKLPPLLERHARVIDAALIDDHRPTTFGAAQRQLAEPS